MPIYLIRPMVAADLPFVLDVQARSYRAGLVESADALASRLSLSPTLCWVAESAAGTEAGRHASLGGYLLSHAWPGHSLPPWNGILAADACSGFSTLTWFVHDLAIAPDGRGAGLASRLHDSAARAAMAMGLSVSRLVAVQAAAGWWARTGYQPLDAGPLAAKLARYGNDAVLMGCALPMTGETGLAAGMAAGGETRAQ